MHGTIGTHVTEAGLALRFSAAAAGRCAACPARKPGICGALRDSELGALSSISARREFAPKETLIEEGDPAGEVYNLVSGTVILSKLLPDGRRQVVGFGLPGDFIGLSVNEASPLTVQALDHVTACRIARPAMADLLDAKPALLRRLHEAVSHELAMAQDHMVLLGRKTAAARVASFLVYHRSRWERLRGPSVRLDLPMTRQDIADYLGVTVETVSRSLTGLAREGAIVVIPDGVRVLDATKLKAVANS